MKKVLEIYIVIINLLYLIFSFLGIFYCIDSYYRDASYEMFAIELFWIAQAVSSVFLVIYPTLLYFKKNELENDFWIYSAISSFILPILLFVISEYIT